MDKFIRHTGIGAPLRRSAVDTDQIIPAVYLKRITRTGFDDALFASWRAGEPDFILNQDAYKRASVLVIIDIVIRHSNSIEGQTGSRLNPDTR